MIEKEAEKKRSLRNEKLKANRTSETEEQRKERLRIRREKDRARRRTKGKKRSPDTDDYEKERLTTLKRLKRGEVDLRLEKVVAIANSLGWPWRPKKKEEQDWRMMQLF